MSWRAEASAREENTRFWGRSVKNVFFTLQWWSSALTELISMHQYCSGCTQNCVSCHRWRFPLTPALDLSVQLKVQLFLSGSTDGVSITQSECVQPINQVPVCVKLPKLGKTSSG